MLLLALQMTKEAAVTSPSNTFDPQRIVWFPNLSIGGGQLGGGDRSATGARPLQLQGNDQRSIASPAHRSTDSTVEQPIEPLPFTAQPIGDAASLLVGAVTSESAGDSLGRGNGPGGDGAGPSGFGDAHRVGWPGVTTPVLITQVKPQYTADAMRAKVQGLVMVECVVMPDGTVGDARIVRSLDPRFGLDQEAITAAKKWRFKPGLLNGTPVPVIVTIELSFTLR